MKLKRRKIKFASIFFVCWFALWVLIVDGIIGFQTLLDKVGSYAIHESVLDAKCNAERLEGSYGVPCLSVDN